MSAQCDPGDCANPCAFCGPENPCTPADCVYGAALPDAPTGCEPCDICGGAGDDPCPLRGCPAYQEPSTPRLTDAEAIARIMVAGRGAEEHKRRWQNGFISESAYNAAVETAIREIARVLREAGR